MSRLIIWICPVIASILILAMQSASAQDVIWGCLGKSGNVRIVGGSGECKSNETEIWWNQEGPEGPPGEQGPQGEQGPPGEGCLRVYSATDEEIGIFAGVDISGPSIYLTVYLPDLEKFVSIDMGSGRFNAHEIDYLFYENTGCPEGELPYAEIWPKGSEKFVYTFRFSTSPEEHKFFVFDWQDTSLQTESLYRPYAGACEDGTEDISHTHLVTEIQFPFNYQVALPLSFE